MRHILAILIALCTLAPAAAQNSPASHIEKAVKALEKEVNAADVVINRDRKKRVITSLTKRFHFVSTEGKSFNKLWEAFVTDAPKASSEVRNGNNISLVFNNGKMEWRYSLSGIPGNASERNATAGKRGLRNVTVRLHIVFRNGNYTSELDIPAATEDVSEMPSAPEGPLFSQRDLKALESLKDLPRALESLKDFKDLAALPDEFAQYGSSYPDGTFRLDPDKFQIPDDVKERLRDLSSGNYKTYTLPDDFYEQMDRLREMRQPSPEVRQWLDEHKERKD